MDYKKYFDGIIQQNRLVADTLELKPTKKIPIARVHIMQHEYIERIAGVKSGEYLKNPEKVYISCLRNIGSDVHWQYIPLNPMRIGNKGYETEEQKNAISSEIKIVRDGMEITSPEDVVEHMEKHVFPKMKKAIEDFNEDNRVEELLSYEKEVQDKIGHDILKFGSNNIIFPILKYDHYGYEAYFMAYALYPEVIEKDFSLQADLGYLNNKAVARARNEGHIPPASWLGHDMAGSESTLVSMDSLEKMWFPHCARCLEPVLKTDIKMIWHCDGNLMQMIPRLIDIGIKGFQGFQYEDGMDYEKICRMKTRDGEGLVIFAGASVTQTLPNGTPEDVKRELKWLVEKGPKTGMFLMANSAVIPGIPWENIKTLLEGLKYYRENGRS